MISARLNRHHGSICSTNNYNGLRWKSCLNNFLRFLYLYLWLLNLKIVFSFCITSYFFHKARINDDKDIWYICVYLCLELTLFWPIKIYLYSFIRNFFNHIYLLVYWIIKKYDYLNFRSSFRDLSSKKRIEMVLIKIFVNISRYVSHKIKIKLWWVYISNLYSVFSDSWWWMGWQPEIYRNLNTP